MDEPETRSTRTCSRCRGKLVYWETAIIAGDALAPPGSNRALAHAQPAWICLDCGHLEAHERRTRTSDDHQIWRP